MTNTQSNTPVSDRTFVARIIAFPFVGFLLFVGALFLFNPGGAHAKPEHGKEHPAPVPATVNHIMPDRLPICASEDGNVDGLPCIFVSKDGFAYYQDSFNYHDDPERFIK